MKRRRYRPLVAIVLCAAALRLLLFFAYPSQLTADSWDYLLAAQDLARSFDFASQGLRDWRMPGYPLLLAAVQPWTAAQSDRIVLVQTMLGLLTVVMAFVAGVMVRSQVTAVGLALFVAFNPVYLLFDHTIMSEGLAIAALVGFLAAVAWACGRQRRAWAAGALVAVMVALCVLTRANLLLFCAVCMLAPPACWAVEDGVRNKEWRGRVLRFAAAASAMLLILVGPWILRNYALYGQPSMLVSLNRNLLVYKAMYNPVDTALPKLQAISRQLGTERVDYDWLWRLTAAYPAEQAEAIAGDLWREQVAAHPERFAADLAKAAAGLTGFYYWGMGDLLAVGAWTGRYMTDASLLDGNNRRVEGHAGFRYAGAVWSGALRELVVRVWAQAGMAYLYLLRPLLTGALLAVFGFYVWTLWQRKLHALHDRDVILVTIFAAFAANAVLHVATLAVNDRFASTFDVVTVFLLLLAADTLGWHRRPVENTPIFFAP